MALLAAALVTLGPAPAQAHAELVRSDPAAGEVLAEPPAAVTLEFSEDVTLDAGSVVLLDADRRRVPVTATERAGVVTVDLPGGLADGSYLLVWHVVSDDLHPEDGSLGFAIGAPTPGLALGADYSTPPATMPVASLVQGLGYVALLLAAGLLLYGTWLLPGAAAATAHERVRRASSTAAAAAVVALAVHVPFEAAYLGSWSLDLLRDEILVAIVAALGLGLAVGVRRWGDDPPAVRVATTAGPALAVVTPALIGHTRVYEPVPLLVVSDVVHLAAGATWLGGVVGLAITLPVLGDRLGRAAVVRFSTVGGIVAGLLVVTGSVMAWRILGSWSGLVTTAWGWVLLAKLAVVAVLLAVAAWNLLRLARGGLLLRTLRIEAGLLAGVLLLAGFLTNQSPTS